MKNKFLIMGVMLFLAIGMVSAVYQENGVEKVKGAIEKELGDGSPVPSLDGSDIEDVAKRELRKNMPVLTASGEDILDSYEGKKLKGKGKIILDDGLSVEFETDGKKIKIKSNGLSADCDGCNLTSENGKIKARLSNGRNAEIKLMPEHASEKALARLRLKNCPIETCTIELKEVGSGNDTKMAYELKTEKKAKFLGIFNSKMNVEATVDAETGEILKVKRPWWSFMASEEDETDESEVPEAE